jgi:ATP-dependent DNA helicase DinG
MALSQEVKNDIQEAYSQWIKNNNLKPRSAQRQMIASIAKSLSSIECDEDGKRKDDFKSHVCLVEAGTGTGKTVAYIITAIILAKFFEKKLVISTATIALQEQLVERDLPNLQKTCGVDFSFSIAKGRKRYFCLNKAENRLKDSKQSDPNKLLFPDEQSSLSDQTIDFISDAKQAFLAGDWDGDKDSWPYSLNEDDWSSVVADTASYCGGKLPKHRECALTISRKELRDVDIIIANHDLVLADLSSGGNILPDPSDTIYVFDEAHHLPEKTQNHQTSKLSIDNERKRILQTEKVLNRVNKILESNEGFDKLQKSINQTDEALESCLINLQNLIKDFFKKNINLANSSLELRFPHGKVPSEMESVFDELSHCFNIKISLLENISEKINKSFTDNNSPEQANRESLSATIDDIIISSEIASHLCEDYSDTQMKNEVLNVRWLRQLDADDPNNIIAFSTPLLPSKSLNKLIWGNCFSAILTSATLTALDRFDHFIEKIGIGEKKLSFKILGQLNYSKSFFHVPSMKNIPSDGVHHTDEIVELLPKLISKKTGTLFLFSSRKQMEDVYESLVDDLKDSILLQGDRSKQKLINMHKSIIDSGEKSIIFGLNSFSEGLDLPGKYCEVVIISKLPFSVPDNPIEQALGEWVESKGGNAFYDISVPNASMKLLQSCGRLLRHESDHGKIFLLDRRIINKSYGRKLLNALPPYNLKIDN